MCNTTKVKETPPVIIGVILARGNSQGIPGKNLACVSGVPLVERSVRCARTAGIFDRILLSSDHTPTLQLGSRLGVTAITCPSQLSIGTASPEDGVIHAVRSLDPLILENPANIIVLLQPTSPFTTPSDLLEGVQALREGATDCSFSARPFHGFVWRKELSRWQEQGFQRSSGSPRQNLPTQVVETGGFYAASAPVWAKYGRFGQSPRPVIVPSWRGIEIDEPSDLVLAQTLSRAFERTVPASHDLLIPKLLVFDFDGVMTNDMVLVGSEGQEAASVSRRDGAATRILLNMGIRIAIITAESGGPARARAEKLGVLFRGGASDKASSIVDVQRELGLGPQDTWVIGNTHLDLPMLPYARYSLAPADAEPSFRDQVSHILNAEGGDHVVESVLNVIRGLRTECDS